MRYEVRVPKEETDMVGDLRYSWKKLRKLSTDVSDNLARLQVSPTSVVMHFDHHKSLLLQAQC